MSRETVRIPLLDCLFPGHAPDTTFLMASDLLLASPLETMDSPLETMESRNRISLWESLDVTGIRGMSLKSPSSDLNAPNPSHEGAPTECTSKHKTPLFADIPVIVRR